MLKGLHRFYEHIKSRSDVHVLVVYVSALTLLSPFCSLLCIGLNLNLTIFISISCTLYTVQVQVDRYMLCVVLVLVLIVSHSLAATCVLYCVNTIRGVARKENERRRSFCEARPGS
jgi:hypothetical protein